MKNISAFGILAALLLSGCTQNMGRAPALSEFSGVTYSGNSDRELVKGYNKLIPGKIKNENSLQTCVLRNVTNREITLSDGSNSFVGAYTGNYYQVNKSSQIQGGGVIAANSKNGKEIIANGTVKYQTSGFVSVERSVRFTLDIAEGDKGLTYNFTNIQQAQSNTGSLANNGYYDVGAWTGADPDLALKKLDEISANIALCLTTI